MLRQISLAWRNVKNNRRTIGLLSLDNWRGVKLWRNKNELSTLAWPCSTNTDKICHYCGNSFALTIYTANESCRIKFLVENS